MLTRDDKLMFSKGFASIALILILVIVFGFGAYYLIAVNNMNQPFLPGNIQKAKSTSISLSEPIPSFSPFEGKTFTYKNFSIKHRTDWNLMTRSNSNFPLKSRFEFYDEAVAIYKDNIYVVIAIRAGHEGSSGGIFFDEEEYQRFLKSHDLVVINEDYFYLWQDHESISELEKSESGSFMWNNLAQVSQKGGYKGFDLVIKKKDYLYTIVVLGNEKGETSNSVQNEILQMLSTISW